MVEPLYHGTNKESQNNIVNDGINLCINPKGGDFAVGFYLTPDLDSAKRLAMRKADFLSTPAIVELALKKSFREFLSVKDFGRITLNSSDSVLIGWAQFIVNNRCGTDYVRSVSSPGGYEDNNLDKRYDIVIGQTADGAISHIFRQCKEEKRMITLFKAKKLLENDYKIQYCISTERALSYLQYGPKEKKGVSWK